MTFLPCGACLALAPGAPTKVWPHLFDAVGREAGALPRFAYSPAPAKSGLIWDEARLSACLTAPAKLLPGAIMLFSRLPKPDDRRAVMAYRNKARS